MARQCLAADRRWRNRRSGLALRTGDRHRADVEPEGASPGPARRSRRSSRHPASSASRLLMTSLSPVPPSLRVVLLSVWLRSSGPGAVARPGVRPMPLSFTARSECVARAARHRQPHLDGPVNLSALERGLSRIWRSRVVAQVARRAARRRRARRAEMALLAARRRTSSTALRCDDGAQREGSRGLSTSMTSSLPASIFEKSRMSLMIVSSDSPLSRMVSRCRAGRRTASCPAAALLMPITPFIGVRIPWLMVAREAARRWPRSRPRPARRVASRLVEQPGVLDRDHRLVGERLEQRHLFVAEGPRGRARRGSCRCRALPHSIGATSTEKLPIRAAREGAGVSGAWVVRSARRRSGTAPCAARTRGLMGDRASG